jgi:DNA (cytosine-5)-methyltransferase 1
VSVTFHDLFCGAGGSTLGAALAGATPLLGANHWPVACESYATNHPDTRVDCADVCTVDPRRYPRADMLLASPECTHHSYASGRKKDDPNLFDPQADLGAERSRATMWDVVRFAEVHDYDAVIVENVEAAVKWGMRQGQKYRHGDYGPLFHAWLNAMSALGYEKQLVHLNSMTVGVPQSRDRLYVVFWKKGMRAPDLNLTPTCWCGACGKLVAGYQQWKRHGATTGSYGVQYVYACPDCHTRVAPVIRPAAAAIDWSLPAERIADRARPLKPATLARIRRGLDRLEQRADVVTLEHLLSGGASVDPDGLIAQVGGNLYERPGYARVWPTDTPMPTLTGTGDRALVVPTTHAGGADRARVAGTAPLPAQTGRQEQALVLSNMTNGVPRLADAEPAATVTGGNKLGLVVANRQHAIAQPAAGRPLHTLDTKGAGYLVDPMQIDLRGENRPRPAAGEPLSTLAASGQHHGLAFVVANYSPGWVRDAHAREVGTLTATDSHAILTYRGPADGRSVAEPASAIATLAQHALVGHAARPADVAVEDCRFRMLQPHELQAAQGFPEDYVLTGTKRDKVAQIGNAVSAPSEAQLVARVIDAIGGRS